MFILIEKLKQDIRKKLTDMTVDEQKEFLVFVKGFFNLKEIVFVKWYLYCCTDINVMNNFYY